MLCEHFLACRQSQTTSLLFRFMRKAMQRRAYGPSWYALRGVAAHDTAARRVGQIPQCWPKCRSETA